MAIDSLEPSDKAVGLLVDVIAGIAVVVKTLAVNDTDDCSDGRVGRPLTVIVVVDVVVAATVIVVSRGDPGRSVG